MNTYEQTESVLKNAGELETLSQRFAATVSKHELDIELSDTQRRQKIDAAKAQVRNRLSVAEKLRESATVTLHSLQPNPEPAPITDQLALFLCQHRLYLMKQPQRLAVFHKAIESSDRLTFDTVVTAPPWLQLVSDVDIQQGRQWWNERHGTLPSSLYTHLSDAIQRLSHAITRLHDQIA